MVNWKTTQRILLRGFLGVFKFLHLKDTDFMDIQQHMHNL